LGFRFMPRVGDFARWKTISQVNSLGIHKQLYPKVLVVSGMGSTRDPMHLFTSNISWVENEKRAHTGPFL